MYEEQLQTTYQEKKDSLYRLTPTETGFDVYIHNDIDEPHYYCELHQSLRSIVASQAIRPEVNIFIATNGGYLSTTLQILNSISTAQQNGVVVNTYADSDVASAGTLLLLAGTTINVQPHNLIMFHSASSGSVGKYQDQKDKLEANEKQWKSLVEDYYSSIFTPEEIEDMYKNKRELYLTSDEFLERLNKLSEQEEEEPVDISEAAPTKITIIPLNDEEEEQ